MNTFSKHSISLEEVKAPPPKNTALVNLPTDILGVLTQSRTFMEKSGLAELASSIKNSGQMTPGIVFAFNIQKAESYVSNINSLWNTAHDISEFDPVYIKERGKNFYLFVVAGHRRLEACKIAEKDYYAQVFFERDFSDAIKMQLEENFHEEVSLQDQIRSAHRLWLFAKSANPNLSIKAFSKKIHKSYSWTIRALRFSDLPVEVQNLLVYNKSDGLSKGVGYNILLEFARLIKFYRDKDKEVNVEEFISWIFFMVANKKTLKDVRDFCSIKILELNGQESFDLSGENLDFVNHKSLATAKREATLAQGHAAEYLSRVNGFAALVTDKGQKNATRVLEQSEETLKI